MSSNFSAPLPYPGSQCRGMRRHVLSALRYSSGGTHIRKLAEDFFVLRETKRLQLGKDLLPVHSDLKGATVSFHKGCDNAKFFFYRGLQTCSVLEVVSLNAIFNQDIHQPHSLPF
jgi:hypothetical protein